MTIKRNNIKKTRTKAHIKQKGLCYYCNKPMWNEKPSEVLNKFNVSKNNLKHFKCTGEHLKAFSEGGASNQSNIVAACWFCNSKRHQRKIVTSVKLYKAHISRRLKQGKWNSGLISDI